MGPLAKHAFEGGVMPDTRPLHLVVIDGWHPGLLRRERAAMPAFEFLAAAGSLDLECVSTFPTVTPAALTTLVTGKRPSAHGIRGIMWYHAQEDRYVHYWPSQQSLLQGTLERVLRDIFLNLNGAHLSTATPTLFERLEEAGLVCGNVNFPISRADYLHRGEVPWLLRRLSGLSEFAHRGPRHCYMGDFIRPHGFRRAGLLGRYGINDRRAADYGAEMIRRVRPDFSLVYLNEHDMRSHQTGPMGCAYSLRIIDAQLGKLMDAYGSWEAAVTEARWIVVGDHAQSPVGGVADYALNVFEAFRARRVAPLASGGLVRGGFDLAVAPNDRAAFIYLRDPGVRDGVLEQVLAWPSADQVAYREGAWCYAVASDNRSMRWRAGGPDCDPLGQAWTVEGDLSVLDLKRTTAGGLGWGEYPDALSRLSDALVGPDLVVNAKRHYEFTTGIRMGKGTHGSLAKEDSLVPLLTVGIKPLVRPMRTLDVAPMVLAAFGLAPSALSDRRHAWPSSVTG